jgi:hypothetical protein
MRASLLLASLALLVSTAGCTCVPASNAPKTGAGTTGAGGDGAAGGAVQNDPKTPIDLPCAKQAREVAGDKGTSWYVRCPGSCASEARVWGTDVYTDDSTVCAAAIHAGRMPESGGVVLVTWVPGPRTHIGSARNGVTSTDYGPWPRSFFVQSVDADGRPTSPAVAPLPEGTVRLSCAMDLSVFPADGPKSARVICPAGCAANGSTWGTDVYTGDSPICRAAIHAGLATDAAGGEAALTIGGREASFKGSDRNGVKSDDYGPYDRTYRLAK